MKPQKNLRTFLRCWYDNFTGSIFATICLVIFVVLFFHSIDPVGRKDFLLLSAPILLACYFSFQNYTLDRLNYKIAYEWMNLEKLNDDLARGIDDLELNRYLFHETRGRGVFRKKLSKELIESYNGVFSRNREERERLEREIQEHQNIIWTLKVIQAIVTGKWKKTAKVNKIKKVQKGYSFVEILMMLNRPM